MKNLKQKYNFLHDLCGLNKKDRRKYLKECSDENIHIISESVFNLLKGVCTSKSKSVHRKVNHFQKDF